MNKGYNKGDIYEDLVHSILLEKSFTTLARAGAGGGSDVIVDSKSNRIINIEVKSAGADYGQKYLRYDKGWKWSSPDGVTDLYDKMGVMDEIDPAFIPKNTNHQNLPKREWSQKRQRLITQAEKDFDQSNFEKGGIELSLDPFFEFYESRDCYYIQIKGSGFYHLAEDKFNLGTQKYDGIIQLRFRAKSIHPHAYFINKKKIKSKRIFEEIRSNEAKEGNLFESNYEIKDRPWDYGFLAVMKQKKPPTPSLYCIEESLGRNFPNFD